MKLLTFLGATTAYETVYVIDEARTHTARFCGVALARFHPDTEMAVFVTPDARAAHLDAFTAEVEDHVTTLTPVAIPDGRNETDLWAIFQAVVDQVAEGDDVIFDITHGFRSLPFLSFLAAAYLRVVRRIHLHAVYYGNWEGRDQSTQPPRTPILDMTRFVDLLDWTVAADRFARFGDAQDLADRLRAARPDYAKQRPDAQTRQSGSLLTKAAEEMTRISLALQLMRPAEAMDAASLLPARIDALEQIPERYPLPFRLVADQVKAAYSSFALSVAAQEADAVSALKLERDMIQWHLERRQYTQAVGLAREWLVTWALLQAGFPDPLHRPTREGVECALGKALRFSRTPDAKLFDCPPDFDQLAANLPAASEVVKLYGQLSDLRNDLMHAGKRHAAKVVKSLSGEIERTCRRINALPLPTKP